MKRNMDLVRSLLLRLEECPHGYAPSRIEVVGHTSEEVGYHFLLMLEAKLIDGAEFSESGHPSPSAMPNRLTWLGHDFLDACRDNGRWRKAQGIFERVGGVTMDVAIKVLTSLLNKQVDELL